MLSSLSNISLPGGMNNKVPVFDIFYKLSQNDYIFMVRWLYLFEKNFERTY